MTIEKQRIAVIGTGAMGSIYAALLADAGHDVYAVDAWADHIAAIRQSGLRVEGASGDRTVTLTATENAADAGEVDLAIIATKADGVEEAARAVGGILAPDASVLAIQNGLGSADKVAAILGAERVMVGVVGGFGAAMRGPGHAWHNGMEFVRFGEYAGGASDRLEHVANIWRSGGFKVLTFDDIHKMVWEKLVCNVAYSGPCTITGMTIGEVLADPDARHVSQTCAVEAWEIAKARGISVEIDDPIDYITTFGEKIPKSRPSMAQDHAARKRCEIDIINGAIPVEAAKIGREAPMNAFLSSIIRARETVFEKG